MPDARPMLLVVGIITASCGTISQGPSQKVHVTTNPPGAQVTLAGRTITTPADITLRRRGWMIVRASKAGHEHACRLIQSHHNPWYALGNSIPAGLGWLIDAPTQGSRMFPGAIHLDLPALAEGEDPIPPPSDADIIYVKQSRRVDMCQPEGRSALASMAEIDAAAAQEANAAMRAYTSIVVTGGSIARKYDILGPVHADTRGMVNLGSALNDSLFRSRLAASIQATPKASTAQLYDFLRYQAVEQYGIGVNAVINVVDRTEPDGDVSADGLAVRFVDEPASPPAPEARPSRESSALPEKRLENLNFLVEHGLVTRDEYQQKRRQILEGF